MASKLFFLFVVLFTTQCALAKEERGIDLIKALIGNTVNAGKAIAANATATISQAVSNNLAVTKDAFDKGIAKAAEDLNNLKQKSAEIINAAIENAKNISDDIKSKVDAAAQNFQSALQQAIEAANETLHEAVEATKQRGADVSNCISAFNGDVSNILNSSESEFQGCSEPYVDPVLNTTSHLGQLKLKSLQLDQDIGQKLLERGSKLDIMGYIADVNSFMKNQGDINSEMAEDLKDLVPQALLAKGGIASCAAASALEANDEVGDAVDDAVECLQNISK